MTAALAPGWALLFSGLLALRVLVLDRGQTPFNFTQLGSLPNPSAINFGDQLALIGSEAAQGDAFVSGRPIEVALYWQAMADLGADYNVSLQLADEQGNRWGQSDQFPALIPTTLWHAGQYARDDHRFASFVGTPPGTYRLVVQVYSLDASSLAPLQWLADGQPAGLEYEVGGVTLERGPAQSPGPLRLLEGQLATETMGVGDSLPFTLLWSSGDQPEAGLSARVDFNSPGGEVLYSTQFPPAGPDYPSEAWTPNELIRYPHSLDLPADLPSGQAAVTMTFVKPDGSTASEPWELGTVNVTVPDRSYEIPDMEYRVDYDFADSIRLLGYDRTAEGLTLYWQGLEPVSRWLTVFVHLYDEAGLFIGGYDAPPPRATTSWLPGEVIRDERSIPSADRFEVGLYDTATGERLGEPYDARP